MLGEVKGHLMAKAAETRPAVSSTSPSELPLHPRTIVTWTLGLFAGSMTFIALVMVGGWYMPISWNKFLYEHFPAIVGLPAAAVLSLLLVVILPQAYGRIQVSMIGMKLDGAASPVFMWLVCFLGIVAAIKLLW
jgi:hypothetical protein